MGGGEEEGGLCVRTTEQSQHLPPLSVGSCRQRRPVCEWAHGKQCRLAQILYSVYVSAFRNAKLIASDTLLCVGGDKEPMEGSV
jgi:hypothetical protein